MSPQPITNVTCLSPNGISLTVQWSPLPDVCGDPGLYYNVTSPQLGSLCPHLPSNVISCDITGLSVNVSYDVQVRAINCAGTSPPLMIPIQVMGRGKGMRERERRGKIGSEEKGWVGREEGWEGREGEIIVCSPNGPDTFSQYSTRSSDL